MLPEICAHCVRQLTGSAVDETSVMVLFHFGECLYRCMTDKKNMKGQVVSGELGRILIREKSGEHIELGELLVAGGDDERVLLQVFDLVYGSQISQQNLELISGMHLEESSSFEFMDATLRNYLLALAKPVLSIGKDGVALCKTLPPFFSSVRAVVKEDVAFLRKPEHSLYIGKLRSGRKVLDVDIYLPGDKVFSHHILIPATTGRGKSNLTSVMLWDCIGKNYCGILVLDPHDEYYGRHSLGLKDHPLAREQVVFYTPNNPPPGAKSLKINLSDLRPQHFDGAVYWSDAQKQAVYAAYNRFGKEWIERLIIEEGGSDETLKRYFQEGTLAVVKRKLMGLLGVRMQGTAVACEGIFDALGGMTTVADICNELEAGKVVIIDTSALSGANEILVGSVVASELMKKYQHYKRVGELENKPVVSVVLEEAPRVLGHDVLQQGSNVFDRIAREGRKFKIGLMAITQLPSAIPRSILANMNTKIILGLEMKPERDAIIESASQDLSMDGRNIAALDRGEALITSNFTKFAIPVKVPLFEEVVKQQVKERVERRYAGIGQ